MQIANKKIGIFSNNEELTDHTLLLLQFAGYQVSHLTARTSLAFFNHENFDLLLLDCSEEGEDACNYCRSLKTNEVTSELPVLMLSAGPQAKSCAFKAGADSYLSGPLDLNELIHRIDQVTNDHLAGVSCSFQ